MSKTQWGLVMGESLEMTAGGRVTEEVGWLWRTWWGGGQGIVVTNIKSERGLRAKIQNQATGAPFHVCHQKWE